jgi:hypothetical protein
MDRAGNIGSILDRIPGYNGYRRKEDRRDADRVVRDQIAAALDGMATRIERVASGFAAKRELEAIGPLNALTQELRLLGTRVQTTSYGYGGLFGNRDVDDAALAQLRSFDETLLAGVAELDPPITAIERATSATIADAAAQARSVVLHLSDQFSARSSVVETAEVSAILPSLPAVAGTIDELAPLVPHPAYDTHDRDAIEILGDQYIVDARVEIKGRDTFRLYRVKSDPNRWLLVPKDPGQSIALLDEGIDFPSDEKPVRASGSVIGAGGEQRDLPVTYIRTTIDGNEALRLDWSGEIQSFVGSNVHPDDIVNYGSTLT